MAYHPSGARLLSVLSYEYSAGNLIGHGAFALVYKGRRKQTLETVAIKQIALKAVPGHLSTIRQKEITILKEVKHSNVVQLYDYHEDQSNIYLVMEYCNGGDLGDYLQAKKTLSEHSIRHLANHIARALSALNKLHIIHRDIKPQNLLLSYTHTGSGGSAGKRGHTITDATIKLADFGFARYLTGTDMAATLCGSPLYMAPEILLGERYDNKADLWSVGTILYQCLAGNAPFLANNPHALRKRYEREKLVVKIPEGTSRYLASLLTKLLKKNRKERLSHEELCAHPFLADSSIQASGYLVMEPQPPRAKSSPVPIKRHTPSPSPSPSPYNTSHRHSGSPRQSPYEVFVSPSSGPPSIHPVGSASSLAHYQSTHSDVTDHGFVLVGSPHSSSPYSSAASSPQSGSYNSCRSHTPSSTGHTPSSSYGSSSVPKFHSLMTPFYQAPPTSRSSNGSTPSEANSPPTQLEQYYQRPRSHSHSAKRRSSEPASSLSHTPPFGRLMQLGMIPTTAPSPHTSPLSSRQASSSPSPSSLTAHSPSSQPHTLTAATAVMASNGGRLSTRSGMRYSLSAHGSGSKLSSLEEQAELEPQPREGDGHGKRRNGNKSARIIIAANKRSSPSSRDRESSVGLEPLITASQVLCSDGEEEEEVGFPLSLSLHSSQSSNKTEEQETAEVEEADEGSGSGRSQIEVATPTCPAKSSRNQRRCKSATGHGVGERDGSFSGQHSEKLSENFQQIRSRAASLSAHQSLLGSDSTPTTTPTAINQYQFQVSPAAEIKPMNPAFLLPSSSSTSSEPSSRLAPSPPRAGELGENCRGSGVVEISDGDLESSQPQGSEGWEGSEEVRVCLGHLRQAMDLARELMGMGQARQGPIMLLSTDLSQSGGVSRSERHYEQLVLYAKAVSILDSGLREFQIEMATSSMELDQTLRTAEVEAGEMQESCLEKARVIREEMEKTRSHHHSHNSHSHHSQLSAERLLLMEALDMCKHAVLNEQTGDSKECVKRYRIAKLIFCHLLSDAKTHRDRTVLSSYVHSVTRRIQRLTSD